MKKPDQVSTSLGTLIAGLVLLQIQPTLQYSIVLDVEKDLFRAWKLGGNYLYVPEGRGLKQMFDKFPEEFDFKPFLGTKGIWTAFPQLTIGAGLNRIDAQSAELLRTLGNYSGSYASFSYTGAAQLIESVTVQYCMNNRANITVSQDGNEQPFYTIEPGTGSGAHFEWISTTVPLGEGSSRFVVQANVNSAHDFVLVDKIEALFVEVTTVRPSTTRRTTTPKPSGSGAGEHRDHSQWGTCILCALVIMRQIFI